MKMQGMRNCGLWLICFLLVVALTRSRIGAFAPNILPKNKLATKSSGPSIVSRLHSAGSEIIEDSEHDASERKKAALTFHGDVSISSDPLPEGTSREDAIAFLRKSETKNLLLSAGGTRPVAEIPMSDELENLWKECCKDYGSEYLPETGDCILSCDSISQFPGVKLVTTVFSGVKAAKSENDSPQYTFLLVGEKQSVSGALAGIFNRLTGNDKKGDSLTPSGLAKSTVSVVESSGNKLAFNFEASIEIIVEFPSFLLKILPVSKEKAEAQGSASISKTISEDARKAVAGVYESYTAK